jgi:hypothetical protein
MQREVENALVKNTDDINCMLSDLVRADVVKAVEGSVNLPPFQTGIYRQRPQGVAGADDQRRRVGSRDAARAVECVRG